MTLLDDSLAFDLSISMKRNPPFAKTGAEAKAMRALRCEQKNVGKKPDAADRVMLTHIRLIPLKPDWIRLTCGRLVNAAIPEPLPGPGPEWAGPRGVMTRSGRVFDYEAAHEMHEFTRSGAAVSTPGEW